ncbi:MAG: PAS domain-containing protein, partial [Caulobacteraceae bacterium]
MLAALALVVAGLGLAIFNERQVEAERVKAISVQAQILAGTVAAPLAFDDVAAARKYADALKADPQIGAAGVYGAEGRLAAGWSRAGESLPARIVAGATERRGQWLTVSTPVVESGARLGAVYLSTVLQPWPRRAERYGGIGLLVLMAALLVGGLGAANVSLARAQRRLRREMAERARTEAALRRSQKMEALAQIETAAERSRAALRLSEAHLEFALRAGELGSWTRDLRSGQFEASPLLRAQYGFTPDEPLEKAEDFIARMHPDDRPSRGGIVGKAIADHAQFETEFRIRKLDGETRWMMVRGRADYDEAGAPLRVAGVSMDVTERKLAEERLRFLVDELNHRVKNTLAAVQSIARQTGRASRSEGEFEGAFIARIDA